MSLARWEPFAEFTPLREAINRMLEESAGLGGWDLLGRIPPVDIRETEGEYVIEASLPGVKPEDTQITATDHMVTIRATKKAEEKTEKAAAYVRRERYEGEMSRTIALPVAVNPDAAQASFDHGVLTLRLPKTEEAKPKQIPVEVKEAITAPAH